MPVILETERLNLREFALEDAEFVIELLNSEGWIKYIGDRKIITIEQAQNYIQEKLIDSYISNGYGLWLVELKESKTAIGMCGIVNRGTLEHPDIGFALLPDYYRKGYAYEGAKASLDYAVNTLKLPTILGITVEYNDSSIKLLKKLGLKFKKTIRLPNDNEELMLFTT